MRLKSLRLYNFRNLIEQTIETDDEFVVFIGENGQGKTNLLEAIYYISYASSFRTHFLKHLVRYGNKQMSLIAHIEDQRNTRTIKIIIKDGTRKIFIDNEEIRDRKELFKLFTCIVFAHEDMEYIKGSPSEQRRFFDQSCVLIDSSYLDSFRMYNSLLKQRNSVLKQKEYSLLSLYDERLADTGMILQRSREKMNVRFNEVFGSMYDEISVSELTPHIEYRPSWRGCSSKQEVLERLEKSSLQDRKYETTVTGPHRDRYVITSEGNDITHSASTGQIRLMSLLLKLLQARIYVETTGRRPVLLLDDVLLELDITKRNRFLEYMDTYDQAFFTFLPEENYGDWENSDTVKYTVRQGECILS